MKRARKPLPRRQPNRRHAFVVSLEVPRLNASAKAVECALRSLLKMRASLTHNWPRIIKATVRPIREG